MLDRLIAVFDKLLFPRNCLGCNARDISLCAGCVSKLGEAREYRDEFTHALFSYDDKVARRAILRLKFCNDKTIIEALSPYAADLVMAILSESLDKIGVNEILLLPIPISKGSYKVRGYNQSLLIAREISKLTGFEVRENILIKTRETEKQAKIKSRELRLKNVVGSFGVTEKDSVAGKTIFLIDDVITTGATMREARSELLASGAKRVFCISLASQPLL